MMNIKLPDINLPDGLDNKVILQQILDAIHKQRKELNFYLMNLDESNMPTIANRIEDAEGNISIINQDIDEIFLSVGNAQGDIAALEIRADEIEATVADNAGNISSLQQTATSLTSRISNAEGNISIINQTVSGIQTTVADLDDDMNWAYSQITQLAGEIDLRVTIGDVVNYLNVNQSGVKIHASNIDLTGITRVYSSTDSRRYIEMRGSSLYIVAGLYEYPIEWDTYINYEFGRGIGTRFVDHVEFEDKVVFYGDVDFEYADVVGLDTDIDTSYLIECYYSSNKCYLDLSSSGTHIIVRDRYGDTVGTIYLE